MVRPPVALTVPVKFAALDIVWPFINPEVIKPAVKLPIFPEVVKRLVEEAVVAKKLVDVALVVVEVSTVRPPTTSSLESVEVEVAPRIT